MISFIFAMDENRLIGKGNELPWRLPEDLKYFKRTTMGHPIIMGRKTFESIGRPLPGRENIIVTRNRDFQWDGCSVFYSIEELLDYCQKYPEQEFFVIGGGEIFAKLFPYASRLYMTYIYHQFEGDTYFPLFDRNEWKLVSKEQGKKDEKNPYTYEFRIYERRN